MRKRIQLGYAQPGSVYGRRRRPIDSLAARVLGAPKVSIPDPVELQQKAERTHNPKKQKQLLKAAFAAEKKLAHKKAAEKAAATRLTNEKAVERARQALERAKWQREND
jgi:hypothetical protein